MEQCHEVFRLIETVRSQGTTENSSYCIEAEQDVNDILDRLLAPFDLSSSQLLTNLSISFRNANWWPWAMVFLDSEYLIAEHIMEARDESRDILFTAYSVGPGTSLPVGSVPPVSILLFKNRAALEQVKDFSHLFGKCWEILNDRSTEKTWVATLDPLPDEWTRRSV